MLSTTDPPTPISRTHLLRTGLETLVEGDSSRPAFTKLVAADRKILVSDPAGNAIRVAYPNTQHATCSAHTHMHTLSIVHPRTHTFALSHTHALSCAYTETLTS